MNDTEQLIREALGKLAERTPHPGPTLNAVRRKHKRHRNVFLIATAGMAAVAVLIFAGVMASDRYTPPNGNDAAAVLVPDNAQGIALKYAPHWLPDGFVEAGRQAGEGVVARVWVPSDAPENAIDGGGPAITVGSSAKQPDTAGWDDVTVRGLKGHLRVLGQTAEVVWKAQDLLVVTVRGVVGDLRETALRVADSVRADTKIAYQPAFRLDGRPATEMGGTGPADWVARADTPARVQVSPRTPQFDGSQTPITVRGKQGFLENGDVAVQEGNLWIVATGDLPVDQLVAAVDKVELVPSPDTSWIRKR